MSVKYTVMTTSEYISLLFHSSTLPHLRRKREISHLYDEDSAVKTLYENGGRQSKDNDVLYMLAKGGRPEQRQ